MNLGAPDEDPTLRAILERGALVLADLHREIGDAEFRRFLRTVQDEFRWKHVTSAGLARVADEFGHEAGVIVRGASDSRSGADP